LALNEHSGLLSTGEKCMFFPSIILRTPVSSHRVAKRRQNNTALAFAQARETSSLQKENNVIEKLGRDSASRKQNRKHRSVAHGLLQTNRAPI